MNDRWMSVDKVVEYLLFSKNIVYTWVNHTGIDNHICMEVQGGRIGSGKSVVVGVSNPSGVNQ